MIPSTATRTAIPMIMVTAMTTVMITTIITTTVMITTMTTTITTTIIMMTIMGMTGIPIAMLTTGSPAMRAAWPSACRSWKL